METEKYKLYSYRWILLSAFMLIVAVNQLLWITFASITSEATEFYNVSDIKIGILSMCFMIVFILVSIPASWIIDTYGIRVGVGIGAVLTGFFGLMRGIFTDEYSFILISQIGIAIGQPFLLNAITKMAANWFPVKERATASGLGTLSMYIGISAGMIITPFLANQSGIQGTLMIYGIVSVIGALIFLILAKDKPPTAPCSTDQEERSLVFDGMKEALINKQFYLLLIVFFIGLGVFNSLATWIEDILSPRGFSPEQAGIIGGVMIFGGIIGALILPILSDHFSNRIFFIKLALIGATTGLAGITFGDSYWILILSASLLGFFLLSSGPIGFQYGAEITFPAPEGTSNGLLLLVGQISGIAFIFAMDSFKSPTTGSMEKPLIFLIILMIISIFISFFLRESSFLHNKIEK
jgi:cyanate permease